MSAVDYTCLLFLLFISLLLSFRIQKYPGYEINQCNIILDVLGGWSKDLDVSLQKLVGSKAKGVLKKMQKACLSGTIKYCAKF